MKASAISDVIVTLVATLGGALSYPVFDGSPTVKVPDSQLILVGTDSYNYDETSTPVDTASSTIEWRGMGAKIRYEDMMIHCVAVGRAVGGSIATARVLANDALDDVASYLAEKPTAETCNAIVGDITAIRSRNVSGGAIVEIVFVIQAKARLTTL